MRLVEIDTLCEFSPKLVILKMIMDDLLMLFVYGDKLDSEVRFQYYLESNSFGVYLSKGLKLQINAMK